MSKSSFDPHQLAASGQIGDKQLNTSIQGRANQFGPLGLFDPLKACDASLKEGLQEMIFLGAKLGSSGVNYKLSGIFAMFASGIGLNLSSDASIAHYAKKQDKGGPAPAA